MASNVTSLQRNCSVCRSPQRETAETLLRAGVSVRNVAEQTGLSPAAVHRHGKHASIGTAEEMVSAARELVTPGVRLDRATLLRGALDVAADNEKLPVLTRALAGVRNADDLRSALQLLLVESITLYNEAHSMQNLTQSLAALKQAGWYAVVLGKAHGWIAPEQVQDNRSVNLFGDLGKEAMVALRGILESEAATTTIDQP